MSPQLKLLSCQHKGKNMGKRIRGGQERVKSSEDCSGRREQETETRIKISEVASNFKDTELAGNESSSRCVGAPHLMEISPVSHLFITARFICFPSRPYNPWCICIILMKAVIITISKGN